jgi:primosomal protein N' (replication factor Y)
VILGVAIDTPLRRLFDYRALSDQPLPALGQRVWVPFGRRRVVGVVIEQRDRSEVPEAKLKQVQGAIDSEPTLDATLLELLRWAAEYYRHPLGEVIATALPVPLRAGAALREDIAAWRLTAAGRQDPLAQLSVRAKHLRAAVQRLLIEDFTEGAEPAIPREALKNLERRGFAERYVRDATPARVVQRTAGPQLNEPQHDAVARIRQSLGRFATWLLHGVTGSGKTEVYLQVIASALAADTQALVLVPEIALTPQLISRFKERFDTSIAVLHSGLNDSERLAAWRAARTGQARIVIGTRSAVFVPLARPGVIVIDEEHDASLKQQDGFRYSARDLAIVRAQRLSIPIVLGSATPSLESLARAERQPGTLLSLPQRAADARPPTLALIDLRKHPQQQGIATPVLQSMQRHLAAGHQVLLFLNRRGYAPVLFCPNCGWSAHCSRCDAHLTVHRNSKNLVCHHCGAEQRAGESCPSCNHAVKPVGQGTERIEETLEQLFPGMPLARIDRDSMRRKGELEATLAQVDRNAIRILVGTQMLTKGHHFPNVTLVVVLNADQGLFSTDFRASERLAQTVIQVAGRAGRAEAPGEVLIQTEYPQHALLTRLLQGGYQAFAEGALEERKQAGWPPFARLALLRAEATHAQEAMTFLRDALACALRYGVRDVELLGPAPAPMERRAGRHRSQLLVQAENHVPLQRLLSVWIPELENLPAARRVRWSIDVDPAELL